MSQEDIAGPLQPRVWLERPENVGVLLSTIARAVLYRFPRFAVDVEDLVFEVIERMLARKVTFETERHLLNWARLAAIHRAIDYVRRPQTTTLSDKLSLRSSEETELSSALEEEELLRALYEAFETLRPTDKETLLLRYGEGLRSKEASARVGLSVAAFDKRLQRAKQELARKLQLSRKLELSTSGK